MTDTQFALGGLLDWQMKKDRDTLEKIGDGLCSSSNGHALFLHAYNWKDYIDIPEMFKGDVLAKLQELIGAHLKELQVQFEKL